MIINQNDTRKLLLLHYDVAITDLPVVKVLLVNLFLLALVVTAPESRHDSHSFNVLIAGNKEIGSVCGLQCCRENGFDKRSQCLSQ